jgi:hypothetical protein
MFLQKSKQASGVQEALFSAPQTPATRRDENWLKARLVKGAERIEFSERVTVTPCLAELMLRRNVRNRPMVEGNVDKFVKLIERGEFRVTHQGVAFDWNGDLLDGQHRLAAVIETAKSVEIIVGFGYDPKVFDALDGGRKRTVGDVLSLKGEGDPNNLAAAIRFCMSYYETGHPRNITPSAAQTIEFLEANPSIRNSIKPARRVKREFGNSLSLWASLHFIFAQIDAEGADKFFYNVATGDGLKKSEPEAVLRSRLITHLSGKSELGRIEYPAVVIKAWNLRRTGQTRRLLSWKADESFPEAV